MIDVAASPSEPAWIAGARCRGSDASIFYPETDADATPAKRLCAGCAVRDACLSYALEAPEWYGVWGGTTERERRRMLRVQQRRSA